MINKIDVQCIKLFRDFLEDNSYGDILCNYMFCNNITETDIITNYTKISRAISEMQSEKKILYKVFLLGHKVHIEKLEKYMSELLLKELIEFGILCKEGETIFSDNYTLLYIKGHYILIDTPYYYDSCIDENTQVYMGWDSLVLLNNRTSREDVDILDLCSGSGIQSISSSNQAKSITNIEINPYAALVNEFNIVINNLEKKAKVTNSSLYESLEGKTFDVIYANPPFLPVDEEIEFNIIGHGGNDGFKVTRSILTGLDRHLKKNGECFIVGECLGNSNVSDLEKLLGEMNLKQFESTILLLNRLSVEIAIENISQMICRVSNNSYSSVKKKMETLYDKKFYYLYILKLKKNGKGINKVIKAYTRWIIEDVPYIKNTYKIKKTEGYKLSTLNDEGININKEVMDFLNRVDGRKSIKDIISDMNIVLSAEVIKKYLDYVTLISSLGIIEKSL